MAVAPPSRYPYPVFPKDILAFAYVELAFFHKRLGNKDAELADLGRAVDIMPSYYLRMRAIAYKQYEMYAEAVADLDRAIYLATVEKHLQIRDFPELYWIRADIFVLMGKFNEAIADYKTFISLSPYRAAIIEKKVAAVKEMMNK